MGRAGASEASAATLGRAFRRLIDTNRLVQPVRSGWLGILGSRHSLRTTSIVPFKFLMSVEGRDMSTGFGDQEERMWAADKRDFVADSRDDDAHRREHAANARERAADEWEAELDDREQHLDARAEEFGLPDGGIVAAVRGD